MTDPALQRKLEGLVDLDYLKTTDGNLYAMSGWAARASESREQIGKAAFESASNLGSAQISARELAFHRHNPVNHPSNQARVGFGISSPANNDLQVLRGHGSSVWKVKPGSDFARLASASGKPVIAGPSGTASRFMAVARFISPGCLRDLGLDSEQAFKELVRYACYGYFGQDDHHSMLEVNLGIAPHGLDEQWDDKLYTEPFSHVIMGRGFSVDNAAQQHIVARATDEPVEHSAADRVG
ncbi:Type III effector HopT1-2 [Pseudomonas syringae pv. berberidis]|nr:Type III effector HopT1-2 [Pseudomonas syringae pv. berberidis]